MNENKCILFSLFLTNSLLAASVWHNRITKRYTYLVWAIGISLAIINFAIIKQIDAGTGDNPLLCRLGWLAIEFMIILSVYCLFHRASSDTSDA
jgi:hypothetical protein